MESGGFTPMQYPVLVNFATFFPQIIHREHSQLALYPRSVRPFLAFALTLRPPKMQHYRLDAVADPKILKRGGRRFISSVLIYRKCAQQNICLLHGKIGFLEKNMSQ